MSESLTLKREISALVAVAVCLFLVACTEPTNRPAPATSVRGSVDPRYAGSRATLGRSYKFEQGSDEVELIGPTFLTTIDASGAFDIELKVPAPGELNPYFCSEIPLSSAVVGVVFVSNGPIMKRGDIQNTYLLELGQQLVLWVYADRAVTYQGPCSGPSFAETVDVTFVEGWNATLVTRNAGASRGIGEIESSQVPRAATWQGVP